MRAHLHLLVLGVLLGGAAATTTAQQPEIVHAQLTTHAADHGLGAELDQLKQRGGPAWVGYTIPVEQGFENGSSDSITYLEGNGNSGGWSATAARKAPQDHAVILVRVARGAVDKLRVESPDRQLDAGALPFLWLTSVGVSDSLATLKGIATSSASDHVRDSAVFLIGLHKSPEATPVLASLAGPGNDLALREKAAFWLANQRGGEGFAVIQRLAREDADARFREKLTFDLTLSKEPDAIAELIRMAHSDASPQVRKQAQFWMATKGGKQVAGDLRQASMDDPDEQVRKSAVFALSRLPGDEAATQLIQVAGSSRDPEVRKQAVFWLGQSNDPKALDYLTRLLSSPNSR